MWVRWLANAVVNWLNRYVGVSVPDATTIEPDFVSSETPDVAQTSGWTNYPSTPMTERREPQGCHLSDEEYVLSNDDIRSLSLYGYSMALGKWLDNEPKPPPDLPANYWQPTSPRCGATDSTDWWNARVPTESSRYDVYHS